MNTTEKIVSGFTLVLIAITAIFAGMTFFSEQANQRGALNIFISSSQYSIHWVNSSNTSNLDFIVSGVIADQARACQVNQLVLQVTLPEFNAFPVNTNQIQDFLFQESFVNGTAYTLNWDNTIFNIGSEKNFTLNMTFDGVTMPQLTLTSEIQGNIHLEYTDHMGTLVEDQSITNWVPIGSVQSV